MAFWVHTAAAVSIGEAGPLFCRPSCLPGSLSEFRTRPRLATGHPPGVASTTIACILVVREKVAQMWPGRTSDGRTSPLAEFRALDTLQTVQLNDERNR